MKNLVLSEPNRAMLAVACPVMKNNDNISMMARSASCFGVDTFIITGQNKINSHISRNCRMDIKHRRSLLPVLKEYRSMRYEILGIEQSEGSIGLSECRFLDGPTLFIVGNECGGISKEIMDVLDDIIEIPLAGEPYSLNVAVALSVCLYERSKQLEELHKRDRSYSVPDKSMPIMVV